MSSSPTSRRRYAEYLDKRREILRDKKSRDVAFVSEVDRKKMRRHRAFLVLLREVWTLMAGRQPLILAALATLTVQSALVLLIPASTKIAIDYIIMDSPGPAGIPRWVPIADHLRQPGGRVALLWLLGAFMLAVTLVRITVGLWGRWQMTRLTKQM